MPVGRSARIQGEWTFSRERPGARSGRSPGAPPRLPVVDIVLDLATAAEKPSEVVALVTRAVQRRRVTVDQLRAGVEHRHRQRYRALLNDLLCDVADGAESPLELSFMKEVERPHGLPDGRRQKSRRGLRYVTDVVYDDYGLLTELDGRAGHQVEGAFRDMRRDNQFVLVSFATLRYGWLTSWPCSVAFQVAAALSQRGWPGPYRRCALCHAAPDIDLFA